jgi:hypothetical protein
VATAASTSLVLVLVAAALLKARDRTASAHGLATFGLRDRPAQRGVLYALIAAELGLACALTVGASWAPAAAALLFSAFGALTGVALVFGRAGRPCACFSGRSRLGWWSPLRAAVLALGAIALAAGWLPQSPSRYDSLLTAALCVSLAVSGALAVAVMALAREVGVLRLDVGARGALEITAEGPELGVRQGWAKLVPRRPGELLRLAIFSSEGCPMCHRVAPAVAHVAADPLVSVRVFDEAADSEVWKHAAVPGSPYAVALDGDGIALAKGTFNSLFQLESILACARAREGRDVALAA